MTNASEYVVTFAHRSLDTRNLHRTTLAGARASVEQAAAWGHCNGRVLLVTDTHEGIEIGPDDEWAD